MRNRFNLDALLWYSKNYERNARSGNLYAVGAASLGATSFSVWAGVVCAICDYCG